MGIDAPTLNRKLADAATHRENAPTSSSARRPDESPAQRTARRTDLAALRVAANHDVNYLTPLMLNAVNRASRGYPLRRLERDLLGLARHCAPGKEDLLGYGRALRELGTGRRRALFPAPVADLGTSVGLDYADLARLLATDAPRGLDNVARMRFGDRTVEAAADQEVQRRGWTFLVTGSADVGGSPAADTDAAARSIAGATFTVTRARCHVMTGDSVLHPRAGIYFTALAATEKSPHVSGTRTRTVGGFRTGDVKNFGDTVRVGDSTGFGCVGASVQAWEGDVGSGDGSFPAELRTYSRTITRGLVEALTEPHRHRTDAGHIAGMVASAVDVISVRVSDDYIGQNVFWLEPEGSHEESAIIVHHAGNGDEPIARGRYEVWARAEEY